MDDTERAKLKQMTLDVIITGDYGSPIVRLAEAVEKLIEEDEKLPHCGTCRCGRVEL